MKKMRFDALQLNGAEILTRDQLKKVLGGQVPADSGCSSCGGTCKTCYEDWCKGKNYCSSGCGTC